MKNFAQENLGVNFKDKRVEVAINLGSVVHHARKQIEKIWKLLPAECIHNIAQGQNYYFKDNKKEIEAKYMYDVNKGNKSKLMISYETKKVSYDLGLEFGLFGKDIDLVNLSGEYFMTFDIGKDPQIDKIGYIFNSYDSDYYRIKNSRMIMSDRDWGTMELVVPYLTLGGIEKVQAQVKTLPLTYQEYCKKDEATINGQQYVSKNELDERRNANIQEALKHASNARNKIMENISKNKKSTDDDDMSNRR